MDGRHTPRRNWVLRHLIIVMIIKLLALVAIWWLFVRDEKVEVNAQSAASHLLFGTPAAASSTDTPEPTANDRVTKPPSLP